MVALLKFIEIRKFAYKGTMIIFSEKLYATSFGDENPIADAVIQQCPHLSEEISKPDGYGKRLSGNEILNILCEGQCEEQKNYGKGNRTVQKISLLGLILNDFKFIIHCDYLIFNILSSRYLFLAGPRQSLFRL